MPFASWSVITVNFLFVLHLALGGVVLAAILHLVNAKWRFDIRNLSVNFFSLFPLAFLLLLVLLAFGAMTFPWVGSREPMPGWNNFAFLAAREIIGFLVIWALYSRFIKYQALSATDPDAGATFRTIALLIPFAHVLFCTMVAWDFEMTLIPGWQSAIYAMYHFVSGFGTFLSVLVLTLMVLVGKGLLRNPPGDYIFNFIAQLLLAFSILWVYTFFAQYLIIWYANLPDEVDRYTHMQGPAFGHLFWTFFVLKFVVPFPILVFPQSRQSRTAIAVVATSIILGFWLERYTWISAAGSQAPGVEPAAIAFTVAILSAAYILFRGGLRRNNLTR